jgi:hypothetical protein
LVTVGRRVDVKTDGVGERTFFPVLEEGSHCPERLHCDIPRGGVATGTFEKQIDLVGPRFHG